jgi:hypothetical protein
LIKILWVQGLFYVLTGLWPLLHLRSFLAVTGPKTDLWLIKTVGALIAAVGWFYCLSAMTGVTQPVIILAIAFPLILLIVDIRYVWTKTIPPVYLIDAGIELIFVLSYGEILLQSK